jgi:hypothetical protein
MSKTPIIFITNKMMMRFFTLLVAVACLASCTNCIEGTGSAVEEKRAILEFTEIELLCSADVSIHQNLVPEAPYLIVYAQENLLPLIKTTLKGDKLVVDLEGCVNSTEQILIEVYSNSISKISNDGSGNIYSIGTVKFESLAVNLDGSGSIELDLSGDELELELNGSGGIEVSGEATSGNFSLDGSGSIKAIDLAMNSGDVECNGSGSISLYVKETLDVQLNGSGDVKYKGNPQNIEQHNNGSGSIRRLD